MRRLLNLNQPGAIFVKMIALFLIIIPAVLYFITLLPGKVATTGILLSAIKVSLAVSGFISVILLILVIVEQVQDHYIDVQYQKYQGRKLRLANGNYECQYCGNRWVKENDKTCQVCGRELQQTTGK